MTEWHRVPILEVKESQTLAEYLRLVIGLDPQPLLRMHSPEALLQFRQEILVHLEIFPWIFMIDPGRPFGQAAYG